MALTERVHSDGAIPPGRKCFLLMQRRIDSQIDNDSGDLLSQITHDDCLDVVTQNNLMLQMLLENQARWNAGQRLDKERMAVERE